MADARASRDDEGAGADGGAVLENDDAAGAAGEINGVSAGRSSVVVSGGGDEEPGAVNGSVAEPSVAEASTVDIAIGRAPKATPA